MNAVSNRRHGWRRYKLHADKTSLTKKMEDGYGPEVWDRWHPRWGWDYIDDWDDSCPCCDRDYHWWEGFLVKYAAMNEGVVHLMEYGYSLCFEHTDKYVGPAFSDYLSVVAWNATHAGDASMVDCLMCLSSESCR
jgi:hypothetical protein